MGCRSAFIFVDIFGYSVPTEYHRVFQGTGIYTFQIFAINFYRSIRKKNQFITILCVFLRQLIYKKYRWFIFGLDNRIRDTCIIEIEWTGHKAYPISKIKNAWIPINQGIHLQRSFEIQMAPYQRRYVPHLRVNDALCDIWDLLHFPKPRLYFFKRTEYPYMYSIYFMGAICQLQALQTFWEHQQRKDGQQFEMFLSRHTKIE